MVCRNLDRCRLGPQRFVSFVSLFKGLTHSQEVLNHETSHFAAQPLSRGEVGAKVDPGENSAQGRLFCSRREALEGALHSGHNFRGDVKVKRIPLEEKNQYPCPGSTNNRVRTRIGGNCSRQLITLAA